jgi:hypothetical protein
MSEIKENFKFWSRGSNTLLVLKWEFLSVFFSIIFFTAWNAVNVGTFRITVFSFFFFMVLSYWLAGRLILGIFPQVFSNIRCFNLYFILGFFLINSLTYLLLFFLPFSLVIDSLIIIFVLLFISKIRTARFIFFDLQRKEKDDLFSFLSLILILLCASCFIQAQYKFGNFMVFRPWSDSWVHSRYISAFGLSHGYSTINDINLSGISAPFYHYASYIPAAELFLVTLTTSYQSYCSFLIPFGFVISGLSAYVFIKYFWGSCAGFFACVVLFLMPSPAHYLTSNYWFNYYWLQLSTPAGLYGVALMLIAWLFMFHGCRKGLISYILISYLVGFYCINYKAQIFIANSFILWVFPSVFIRKFSVITKFIWCFLSVIIYFAAVKFSQHIPSLPLIKLDGSAFYDFVICIGSFFEYHWIVALKSRILDFYYLLEPYKVWVYNLLASHNLGFIGSILHYSVISFVVLIAIAVVFICTLGVLGLLYIYLFRILKDRLSLDLLTFPLICIVSFLIMALGLAYDSHGIRTRDELLHRPFVWVYFVVAIWVGGAMCVFLKEKLKNKLFNLKIITILFLSLLFFIIIFLKFDPSRAPRIWFNYLNTKVPIGFVSACEYIRNNSEAGDIIQDSNNDLKASSMAERQNYVANTSSPIFRKRFREFYRLKLINDKDAILSFFIQRKIKWYILHPDDINAWPKDLLDSYIFEASGYKVFLFNKSNNTEISGTTNEGVFNMEIRPESISPDYLYNIGKISFAIDVFSSDYEIKGWAFIEGVAITEEVNKFIILRTKKDNSFLKIKVFNEYRPDVSVNTNSGHMYDYSGFLFYPFLLDIPNGKYQIGILLEAGYKKGFVWTERYLEIR